MNLEQPLFGATFQNPILLASGTCGYGQELDDTIDLEELGGFVIKAVTVEPREGNPSPRVTEHNGVMLNSIGLANVGLARVAAERLPWLASRLKRARVLVNVAGKTEEEFVTIIERLSDQDGFVAFELNVSCPNVKQGGALFSTREDLLAGVVRAARRATSRPIIVKLAPNVPDIGRMAEVSVAEGADGLTLINTFPGLVFDVKTRRPALGNGTGGVSGPGILPMGVYAVAQARRRVQVPIIGVGGVTSGADALQYLYAGASLVQIGTASFSDPRASVRVLSELRRLAASMAVTDIRELVGAGRLD